jgi:hypothetical protein
MIFLSETAARERFAADGIEGKRQQQKETTMDRRLFVTGVIGVSATTAMAFALPRQAQALIAVPPENLGPLSDGLPDLTTPEADATAPESDWKDNVELVYHRRRRRVRRWRRRCRRHWWYGHWRRRCRRVPFWVWISIGI